MLAEGGIRMNTKIAMVCVALVVFILSALAAHDALRFALVPADPISGRARGCYSMLERIGRLHQPSAALRNAQLYCGLAGIVASVCALGYARRGSSADGSVRPPPRPRRSSAPRRGL